MIIAFLMYWLCKFINFTSRLLFKFDYNRDLINEFEKEFFDYFTEV